MQAPAVLKSSIILFITFSVLVISFQNCAEQPRVVSSLGSEGKSNFDHTGIVDGCASCHTKDFPTATHIPINGADCSSCHTPAGWKAPGGIAGDPHNPKPSNCAICHAAGTAYARYPTNHRPVNGADCASCHTTPPSVPASRTLWATANYAHMPVPTSCNSCHNQERPAVARYPTGMTANNHYVAKDCATCHQTTTTRFSFNHRGSNNSEVGFCLPCHDSNSARSEHRNDPNYFVGDGTCQTCHTLQRPRGIN